MNRLVILFCGLFLGCSPPENQDKGMQLSVNQAAIQPRVFAHDSINKHPYEIRYWLHNSEDNYFDSRKPEITKLRFSNFTFKIDGEMWRMEEENQDTLTISEDVGYYLEGRKMWIESQDTSDRFELYMSVQQRIQEQYDPKIHDKVDFDWEKWEKERVKIDIRSAYYKVQDSSGYYKLPWAHTGGEFFERRFKATHDYTDTTRHIDGEMGGSTATLFIQNKFCIYWNDFAMFKIVKTARDGKITNHYFKMWYSYGC